MSARREIGGYLEFEQFHGTPLHKAEDGAIALNCARDCLEYLLELRKPEALWLPDWMCSCQEEVCKRVGVPAKIYRVGADLRPEYDFEVADGEWLCLMDFYGQLDAEDVAVAFEKCDGRLIVDETQGFFRKPWAGADTMYTCRKYFGVADGAYLYTADGTRLERPLQRAESFNRMQFVMGRFERTAGEFFAEACDNNDWFDGVPLLEMSLLTENIMRALDYEGIRERRVANFSYLHQKFGQVNLLKGLKIPYSPFMYPLLVEDAGNVRRELAAEGIFIPTLWPNCLEDCPEDSVAYRYSKNVLPLPIDQRYNLEDMERVFTSLRDKM